MARGVRQLSAPRRGLSGGTSATLDQAIDGNASGLPGGTASPQFTGLHRIEYGLWTSTEPRALLSQARQLNVNVRRLRGILGKTSIEPLEYATRAHEILEDAARDLLSGADVPWSKEGVLATNAGLQATEEVIATLHQLLVGRENTIPIVKTELAALRSVMASLAAAHGGRLPSNAQLTRLRRCYSTAHSAGRLRRCLRCPEPWRPNSHRRFPRSQSATLGSNHE